MYWSMVYWSKMMRYSNVPEDRISVKGYGFSSFTYNNSKDLSSKYSHRLLDLAKQSAADRVKIASKIANQNKSRGTGDLIGNKIADDITKVSRTSPQDSLEGVESEIENNRLDRKVYTSPEKKQKIIDDLRLV